MKKYDCHHIRELLKDDMVFTTLLEYCNFLANKYDQTNEGRYRIKYNALHPVLFSPLSDEKLEEYFNSFATSLNIYPILTTNLEGIFLKTF